MLFLILYVLLKLCKNDNKLEKRSHYYLPIKASSGLAWSIRIWDLVWDRNRAQKMFAWSGSVWNFCWLKASVDGLYGLARSIPYDEELPPRNRDEDLVILETVDNLHLKQADWPGLRDSSWRIHLAISVGPCSLHSIIIANSRCHGLIILQVPYRVLNVYSQQLQKKWK